MSVLLTERLRLKPLSGDLLSAYHMLANNENIAGRMEHMQHPLTLEHVAKYFEQTRERNFVFQSRITNELIGSFDFKVENSAMTIGYWIGEPHWGQGYAREALTCLLSNAFLNLGVQSVSAKVDPANVASFGLLAKLGFVATGATTCKPVSSGVELDATLLTMTRGQYEQLFVTAGCALPYPVRELPTVLVSAVALIDADGRILLAQRPEGKSMAGLWEFPGGKIENGETPESALKRELNEELGISTELSCFAPLTFASHSYEDFHLLMTVFACRTYEGTPQGKEGQNLKWVPLHKLREYPMPEADKPLVALIQDYL